MAKKKKKNIDIDAQFGENKINIDRIDDNLDISIDTKNIDVDIHKDEDSKSFNYDSKNLDVSINKDADKTEIQISATNKFFGWIGKIIKKIVLRKKKK
tara:strand:+ start:17209 stop:17502 length:294 start_codon:yes stop_codon:yes gene_type:complete